MLGGLRKLPGCGAEWPAVGGPAGAGWERMDLPSSGAQWMGNLQRNLCRSSSAGPALPRFLHCLVSCPSPNFPLALPNCSMQTSSKGRSLMKTHLHPPYPPFIFCSPFSPCSWTCLRLSHRSAVVVALRPPLVASAECGRGLSLGGDPRAATVTGGGGRRGRNAHGEVRFSESPLVQY